MTDIYTSGAYLNQTKTWHAEDSSWKADQIEAILQKNQIRPEIVAEVGCGAGRILLELSRKEYLKRTIFQGFDISPQAIALCEPVANDRLSFACRDPLADQHEALFDLLLAIDVFEHVPDYLGFLERCRASAKHKLYHIPLDLHVSGVMRNSFWESRYTLGHLHYFTADSALRTLKDTGHEVIDYAYTNGAFDLFRQHPSFKRAVANIPRWLFSRFSVPLTARMFGGYSLLVLAS
ncbi:MAG: class I SAM-dependent methyltransferase [Methylococcaceae bacterium]|nr:class I SAM-dependent methyltransferase [Methylococcaceae bacterium]